MAIGFEVRQLEEWATFLDVQKTLGYKSNQAAHDLVFTQRAFGPDDVRYIQMRTQPLYLVRWSALRALKKKRDEAAARPAQPPAETFAAVLRRNIRAALGAKPTGRLHPDQLARMSRILGGPVPRLADLDEEQLERVLDGLTTSA